MPILNKNLQPVMRVDGWPEALQEFIDFRKNMAFVWGENDCCTFAAEAVEVCTGSNPLADLTAWESERDALRVLKDNGGMQAMVTARLGQPVPVKMAQRGDVLMVNMQGREGLVICMGAQYVGAGPDGVVTGLTGDAVMAWRV